MPALVESGMRNAQLVPQEWWFGNKDGSSSVNHLSLIQMGMTLENIQEIAGMNFKALVSRLIRESDNAETNHWQIYRDDTGQTLCALEQVVKPHVVQPEEILEFMNLIREETDGEWLTAGVLKNAKLWAQIRTGSDYQIASDQIIPNFLIAYDYNTQSGQGKQCETTAVCANTVAMGLAERLGYNLTFNSLDAKAKNTILEALKIGESKGKRYREVMERAHQVPCDLDGADVLTFASICDDLSLLDKCIAASGKDGLLSILEENRKKGAIRTFESASKQARMVYGAVNAESASPGQSSRGENWYAVHQGLTQYVSNVAGRDGETRLDSGMFGPRALMVEKSVSLLDRILDLVE